MTRDPTFESNSFDRSGRFEVSPVEPSGGPEPQVVEFDAEPVTLARFLELVEQQLIAALERSRAGLDERTLTAAAVGWFRRSGVDLDPLVMVYWVLRASGVRPDPHHARLAAAAALAYVASEIERDPSEGPWALARPVARQACSRELLRMASRLAQGLPACAELIDAHAEVLGADRRPGSTRLPALELVCTCAALAAGVGEEQVDAFATAGDATARIAWWVDELRRLLRPLDRAGFEARRAGPVLRLFAEVSSFEQREELVELLDQLPRSNACLHEFLYRSGLVGRCAEAIELARREVHEQLASVAACGPERRRVAALRNWLVSVDKLAANLYRVPELPISATTRAAEGPWSRLVEATLGDLDERLRGVAQPLAPLRFRAWGKPDWRFDPMHAVVFYPDLDGQPEELAPILAERLGTDPDEVAEVIESLAPLFVIHEAVHAWRDAAGLGDGASELDLEAAGRIAVAYLQRFEPAVLAVVQRVVDHVPAHAGPLDARVRELLVERLDLDDELACFVFRPRAAAGEPAANEPPGETGLRTRVDAQTSSPDRAMRTRAWVRGISAACEQALIELCAPIHWRRSVGATLARKPGGLIDLWAELADELGFEFSEGSLRGAVNHVQACNFGLVEELRAGAARYVDPREAPQIQAALSNLAEHLGGHCEVEPDDRIEATRLLARAHAAQWRDTRGEVVDVGSWWAIAEDLAGDQLAAYFVRFCSGVIASERAAALGHALGVLTHLGVALDRDDPRLLRNGRAAVSSLIDRAIAQTHPVMASERTPVSIRRRGLLLIDHLRIRA